MRCRQSTTWSRWLGASRDSWGPGIVPRSNQTICFRKSFGQTKSSDLLFLHSLRCDFQPLNECEFRDRITTCLTCLQGWRGRRRGEVKGGGGLRKWAEALNQYETTKETNREIPLCMISHVWICKHEISKHNVLRWGFPASKPSNMKYFAMKRESQRIKLIFEVGPQWE